MDKSKKTSVNLSMMLREKINKLPSKTGVYIFKDENGDYLYIGKAENIKKRVKTHLENPNPSGKEAVLARKTASIDYMVTPSEVEALILECNLIKEYKPRYNVMLKDDKKYPYIKITSGEKFPTVYLTRDLNDKPAKYFGPYTNAKAVRKILPFLRRIFPFKICKKNKADNKPCLDYHISRCIGPCTGRVSEEDYRDIINGVSMFLEGKVENLFSNLKEKMDKASVARDYEKAGRLRDQIEAIRKMSPSPIVSRLKNANQDFIGYAGEKNKALIVLLKVRCGKLLAQEKFDLITKTGSKINEAIESFIKQYYSSSLPLPDEIFLPVIIEEKNLLEEWFKKTNRKDVRIFVPQKGDKKRLLQMASNNARYKLMEEIASPSKYLNLFMELKEKLNLPSVPSKIEGIDISNIKGQHAVGSVVVFDKGYPKKNDWRKFKIKSISTVDDYTMMREVIERRYRRLIDEKNKLPDLVLVDGGKGQVGIARQVFNGLAIENIPVIGIAKGENEIHLSYSSKVISLNPRIESFRFLARVRDEAHRFAHSYYQILKQKEIKKSLGREIPTIGKKLERQIIKHFGSWERVEKASLQELMKVNGIGEKKAKIILGFFRKQS